MVEFPALSHFTQVSWVGSGRGIFLLPQFSLMGGKKRQAQKTLPPEKAKRPYAKQPTNYDTRVMIATVEIYCNKPCMQWESAVLAAAAAASMGRMKT